MINNFEDFIEFYENYGFCINDIKKVKSEKKLNVVQLKSKYEKYIKQEQKKNDRIKRNNDKIIENKENKIIEVEIEQERFQKIYDTVDKRDNYSCRLLKILTADEKKQLKRNSNGLFKILDHAHIIGRNEEPSLKYAVNNIILLNRYSHSNLDKYIHPVTGKCISKEEQLEWWYKIVGKKYYEMLKIKATMSKVSNESLDSKINRLVNDNFENLLL